MSVAVARDQGGVMWSARKAGLLVVGLHVAFLLQSVITTGFGLGGAPGNANPLLVALLAVAVFAIQLRHAFAISRGERPRGAVWTMLALAVLVYLPLRWFGWGWAALQASLMASVPMFLRGWPAIAAVALPILGTDAVILARPGTLADLSVPDLAFLVAYWTANLMFYFVGLYGSARLLRLAGDLHDTRSELAAMAVVGERVRVSRDIHDLLGQSLAAVSLKGDLAIRLLRRDPAGARTEIVSLTRLARDALRGIRSVSYDQAAPSLTTEADGAVALLSVAGIHTAVELDVTNLTPGAEQVLAWGLREGVANVLRHSSARSCSIAAWRGTDIVALKITNDGAASPGPQGSGITGLTERARALSGRVVATQRDETFELLVELPGAAG